MADDRPVEWALHYVRGLSTSTWTLNKVPSAHLKYWYCNIFMVLNICIIMGINIEGRLIHYTINSKSYSIMFWLYTFMFKVCKSSLVTQIRKTICWDQLVISFYFFYYYYYYEIVKMQTSFIRNSQIWLIGVHYFICLDCLSFFCLLMDFNSYLLASHEWGFHFNDCQK